MILNFKAKKAPEKPEPLHIPFLLIVVLLLQFFIAAFLSQ